MRKKVIVIPADGSKPIHWKETDGSLESCQAIVGGLIERVPDGHGHDLWVNEEGLLIGLRHNMRATVVAGRDLVGDCYVTGRRLDTLAERLGLGDETE